MSDFLAGESPRLQGGEHVNSEQIAQYKRYGDAAMDESFFPIVWQADGYRTPFLKDSVARRN
ncbi:hypothetical protein IQ241_21420 [Romeria aff. gracilis LEGE 07310]|uniref:Uncharacterized protein n=1 Tax=Vasconcelosia minhoensis LEGE 07310 TaxID=915328 RepID=A0A8J7DDF4_9CYAN|nr:hypothetical protein [Romeria gracilis]MBE9079822.1 hypothetical protein [Romeria aff. gracilis LEGE 07310]